MMKEEPYHKISVKTTTRSGKGSIFFNDNTLNQIDRIMIVQVDTENLEINISYDGLVAEAINLMSEPNKDRKRRISLSQFTQKEPSGEKPKVATSASFEGYRIDKLEKDRIEVFKNDIYVGDEKNKEHLRRIAQQIDVDINNGKGNPLVTQTLGDKIISQLTN